MSYRIEAYKYQNRPSYTGRMVKMKKVNGEWVPVDGCYAQRLLSNGKTANVLCHCEDKPPPVNWFKRM